MNSKMLYLFSILVLMIGFVLVPSVLSCAKSLLCPGGEAYVWCQTFGECGEEPEEHDCGKTANSVWCKCLGNTSTFHCPPEV